MSLLLLCFACSNDFGLERVVDPQAAPGPGDLDDPVVDTAEVPTEDTAEPADDTAVEDDEDPIEDTAPGEDTAVDEDPAPADDCDHTSDLVYAISRDDNHLYTFDPRTTRFSDLGEIDCGVSYTPASMAVSRDGTAWIRYSDDAVYEVDLTTLDCHASGYGGRRGGFGSFGMGYATDSAGSWRDKLYVANDATLAVLDPTTWTLSPVGAMASQSELTGNADGELWAMLPLEKVARLAQLDKSTGAELTTLPLPAFPDPSTIDTFAFATWNGNFYLFVRKSGMGETTAVYEVTRAGAMTRVVEDSGLIVVGAGVSTCAPA